MKKYSYTIEALEVVISACDLSELNMVANEVKKELHLYENDEIKKLVHLIGERFEYLTFLQNCVNVAQGRNFQLQCFSIGQTGIGRFDKIEMFIEARLVVCFPFS